MHPLFTLVAGVVVGVMGVRLTKSANAQKALQLTAARGGETVRTGLDQARSGVREAAVSGLETIEKTSAGLRRKLSNSPLKEASHVPGNEDAAARAEAKDGEESS